MLRRRPAADEHLPPGVEETRRKRKENIWNDWGHAAPATGGRRTFATRRKGNLGKTYKKLWNKWGHAAPATSGRGTLATGN